MHIVVHIADRFYQERTVLTPQSSAILTASNIGDSIQYSLASHLFTATYNPWFLENFRRGLNSDNPQTIH
jgi:hypothetical protein